MSSSNTISVNEPDFQISLETTHTFLGKSTEITWPYLLDSRIISSVLFSFSGTVDQSVPVSPTQMLHSSAIKTFIQHLNLNAEYLCISAISEVILDDQSLGRPEVSVTLSCSADLSSSPCLPVLSINLAYNWTSLRQPSLGLSIFSPQILLPFQPALNKLVHKLFSAHIFGRYPWLFGPLRTKLHLELRWFPSLVRSLLAITAQSKNFSFRSESQALLKRIHNTVSIYKRVVGDTHCFLCSQLAPCSCPNDSQEAEGSDEDTLIVALELVLKIATRSPPFKGARCLTASKRSSSDDEETLNLYEPVVCRPSQHISGDTLSWDDIVPPETCFSTGCAPELGENIWSGETEDLVVGDDKPYSTLQTYSPEGSRLTISEKSLTCQSNCDSGAHDRDENEISSTDTSPLLVPEWRARMRKHASSIQCENFTAPDFDLNDTDTMLLAFD